jgi:hypothetical protein
VNKNSKKIKLDMLAGSLDACLKEEVNDLNNKNLIFQRLLVQSISRKKKWM